MQGTQVIDSWLQALVLDGNKLGKLSGSVGIFRRLRVLSFSNNIIEMLPEEIAENQALTDLQLDGNKYVNASPFVPVTSYAYISCLDLVMKYPHQLVRSSAVKTMCSKVGWLRDRYFQL